MTVWSSRETARESFCRRFTVCLVCNARSSGRAAALGLPTRGGKNAAPGDEQPGSRQVPGSQKTYTQAEIEDLSNPPDWFPDDHAPMPSIVQRGSGKAVPACASCHLVSGMGHPESSHLAGLPAAY